MRPTAHSLRPLVAACLVVAIATVGAQRPEVKARVDAFIDALSSGATDQFETMAHEHYAPSLLALRTSQERASVASQIHEELGTLQADDVNAAPGHWEIVVHGSKGGRLRLIVELQTEPPFKITDVGIQRLSGGDQGGDALSKPPIDKTMNGPELWASLDGYLSKLSANGEFGGVVAVAKNGTTVFERAYGSLNPHEKSVPLTTDRQFNLASIGKAFTKAAIG